MVRAGVLRQTVCEVSGSVYSRCAARRLDSQGSQAVGLCQAVDVGFRQLTVAAFVFQFILTPKRCKEIGSVKIAVPRVQCSRCNVVMDTDINNI